MGASTRRAAWISASIAAAAIAACAAPAAVAPARSPAAVASAHASTTGCEGCHAPIAREWRASLHAQAFRHSTFQRAYAVEPMPFCVGCHAPLTDATAPRAPEADLGVACVACHPGGARTAARGAPASAADRACARCHEFPYPDGLAAGRLLQRTASEHAASSVSHVSCIQCHMPRTPGAAGHLDHSFAASRDEALVRAAARITARLEPGAVVVRFERRAVGHAFPTGDLFRRLVVTVSTDAGEVRTRLARSTKREVEVDTRPFAAGADVEEVRVPIAGAARAFRVDYERVLHPLDEDGDRAVVDGAIVVAGGPLGGAAGGAPAPRAQ